MVRMAAFTNSGADVQQQGQMTPRAPCAPSFPLEEMYEISYCVSWVRQGGYRKVCLQFPDELLEDAATVACALTSKLGQLVYILGDTTYSSCCVDEVAAEHVGSDAVIHFGNTCLSPSQRLPVLYIPTKLPVDVSRVVEQLKNTLKEEVDSAHPLILLFDTRCHYAAGELFSELQCIFPRVVLSTLEGIWHEQKSAECCNVLENWKSDLRCNYNASEDYETPSEKDNATLKCDDSSTTLEDIWHEQKSANCFKMMENCKSNLKCNDNASGDCETPLKKTNTIIKCSDSYKTNVWNSLAKTLENSHREVKFNGRCVSIPNWADIKDCSFIYLGLKGPTLDSLLLRFAENTFYHVSPSEGVVEKLSGMQSLFRRSSKLEKIRDADIIGILVGTLGVARYREAITRLKTMIKAAGKRSYTFVVGKPNEPKLANISEVDVFVYVACPETTIVDRGSDPILYRKLVAPWEVEVALVAGREWSMTFEPDFSVMLPGGARYMEISEAPRQEEASVSLITNRTQALGLRNTTSNEEATAGPVVVQESKVLATIHIGGGGQVLGGRSWVGLDPSQSPPVMGAPVVVGRRGIAAVYQDEKA